MDNNNNKNKLPVDVDPYEGRELSRVVRDDLTLREHWEIGKEKLKARGRSHMVIADFLIESGLIKDIFSRRKK